MTVMPKQGNDWNTLQAQLQAMTQDDIDWRGGRIAVFVFDPGQAVLNVAKEAYAMFQSENGLGANSAFPSLKRMEEDVVSMGLDLLNAPRGASGSLTSGGSESIFLAVKSCREEARKRGIDTRGAEILMPRSGHPAFDKAAHYLDLKTVRIPVDEHYLADLAALRAAISDRTIMLVGSAPCYPYGLIDPIPDLSTLALEFDLWLHVDACVGGYFAPFAKMNGVEIVDFDFSLPGVRTMSADLHKYGYAAKGASTLFHRTKEQHELQMFRCDQWACGEMKTPTVAGTRPGGAIASAWAVMHYLGVEGYREKVKTVTDTREKLTAGIASIEDMQVFGSPKLGLMLYGSSQGDTYAIWQEMTQRGWFSPPLNEPDSIHLMLSPGHAKIVDHYLSDLRSAVRKVRGSAQTKPVMRPQYTA